MSGQTPADSLTEMTELVLPQHGNVLGTAFGGTILAWMDVCGAIAAQRHCHRVAVTAAMDDVSFVAPIRVGDVVVLRARLTAAFRTSMEVHVEVMVEDTPSGERMRCVDAYMTFVNVGRDGKPAAVPPLVAADEDDERRQREAVARRQDRLSRR